MNPRFLGPILVLMAVAAHADDSFNSSGFHLKSGLSLAGMTQADSDPASYRSSYYTPDGAYAALDAVQVDLERQRQFAALREQFYEAIGIADYIPRGNFMAGGIQTSWHLTASVQHSLALSLDARW